MTDYTARNVLLKDSSGNYLIPYTEKADLSLGNLNSAGKAYVAIKGYNSSAAYYLNEVVMTVVSDSVLLYRSLADNNTSSLSDTTKWEEVELGGGSDIDNSTITLNSNDEIQTVGIIDNRSGSALKLWTGTRSQYNAIQNKDSNTLYNITDDTGDLGTFANTDLSNLSNTGEAHFANPALTNSPYTTNRILEIPQDIKLELNNGTLTLKAGSKLYDGAGYSWITQTDMTRTLSGGNAVYLFVIEKDSSTSHFYPVSYSYSQNTQPTTAGVWFNTDTNVIKCSNNGTTWGDCSLPIGIVTVSEGAITSIDQIFNGFGYIGSTVFALPGVKVQCANGRNEDGTYNYLLKETTSVIRTRVSGSGVGQYIMIDSNGNMAGPTDEVKYDSELNYYIYTHDNSKQSWCIFAGLNSESDKITSWKPYTVDSVANSNASNFSQAGRSYLSGLGMPSGRYIDLTLGASGATYTAPANGWFAAIGNPTSTTGYFAFAQTDTSIGSGTIIVPDTTYTGTRTSICCSKGKSVALYYGRMDVAVLRFYYAEGEN